MDDEEILVVKPISGSGRTMERFRPLVAAESLLLLQAYCVEKLRPLIDQGDNWPIDSGMEFVPMMGRNDKPEKPLADGVSDVEVVAHHQRRPLVRQSLTADGVVHRAAARPPTA